MSTNMRKQLAKVNALSESLLELEKKLEPLLSKPLPDTLNSLDTMQQAKLQVAMPYLINDLIFIYLKTRGIDPKTHPVVAELDRVRQYFGKIKDAEESSQKRTTEVDRAAAGRFIKHAISEARQSATSQLSTNKACPSKPQRSTFVPVRMTEKMRKREEYQERLAEQSASEEGDLEIIGDAIEDKDVERSTWKGKNVARAEAVAEQEVHESVGVHSESPKRKKRKSPIDPFGSVSEDVAFTAGPSKKPQKKKKKKIAESIDNNTTADSRPSSDVDTAERELRSKKTKLKG